MNTGSSKSLDSGAWRDLYKAALFEVDNARLPERIVQAEKALALRARELFHTAGDNIEEEQALDDTMYALHALRNTSQTSHCIPHRKLPSRWRLRVAEKVCRPGKAMHCAKPKPGG